VLVGKQKHKQCILSLSLELLKSGCYDFPTHMMASGLVTRFFFKWLSGRAALDVPAINFLSDDLSAVNGVRLSPSRRCVPFVFPHNTQGYRLLATGLGA
jgi:hypothetical protein